MMLRNYITVKNMDYHKKQIAEQIKYNLSARTALITHLFPNDINPDLDDPKYAFLIINSPYNPNIMGGIAESLGLDKRVITIELLDLLQHGWAPVDKYSEVSKNDLLVTPNGNFAKFRHTSTPLTQEGKLDPGSAAKDGRPGMEFMFTHGERLSTGLTLMNIEDPTVMNRFKDGAHRIFNEEILPEILNLARIRKGANGIEYEAAAEILVVPYFHIENRAGVPYFHFHFTLFNAARSYDGNLYSLCTDEICANVSSLDAKYMSSMKEFIETEFDLPLEEVKHSEDMENDFLEHNERKTVSFDLPEAIIPKDIQEWRSAREREMEAELKEKGQKGYAAKENARHATRDDKTELSPSELHEEWDGVYKAKGWSVTKFRADMKKYREEFVQGPTPTDKNIESSFLRHNVKLKVIPTDSILENSFLRLHKDVAFTEQQYLAHIQKQLIAFMSSDEAKREATRIFEATCNLSLSNDQTEYFKPLLENTIADPVERSSMQLRYMREARFIHTSTIERDAYISDSLKARQHEDHLCLDRSIVEHEILDYEVGRSSQGKNFKFTKEQRDAIIMICCDAGAVSNTAGRAGSGKSTLLDCANGILIKNGREIYGISTGSAATKNLADSTGLKEGEYFNTTQFINRLKKKEIVLTEKSVVVWDEAGMADTMTFYEVIKFVNEAGATLKLVGEKEQLNPIGAGGSFRILNEQFVTTPVMQINRQVDSWQREMVEDFASGRSVKALRTLHDNGRVVITKTEEERLAKLVDDYLHAKETVYSGNVTFKFKSTDGQAHQVDASALTFTETITPKDGKDQTPRDVVKTFSNYELLNLSRSEKKRDRYMFKKALEQATGLSIKKILSVDDHLVRTQQDVLPKDKIIMAGTNNAISMINEAVREKLKADGLLPTADVILVGNDGEERPFTNGDRVLFTKNQKSDDAKTQKMMNSDQGTVSSIVYGRNGVAKALKLKMDDAREVTLDLSKTHNIRHAYAASVHKAQGATKTSAFYWVAKNMNSLHSAYVACSRHRKNLTMYLSDDLVADLEDKMEGKAPTASMKKVAEWVAKEQKLSLPPETLESFKETRTWLNTNWKGAAGEEAHPLDRLISISEAMARTNFKRTSHDYTVLDGHAKNTYEALKMQRIEQIRTHKTRAVKPPEAIQARLSRSNAHKVAVKNTQAQQKAEKMARDLQISLTQKPKQTKRSSLRM
jgi:hypothetical protein